MTTTEILKEIEEEGLQMEVYAVLHQWVLNDRKAWMDCAKEARASLRAIGCMAENGEAKSCRKGALQGIISLCQDFISGA